MKTKNVIKTAMFTLMLFVANLAIAQTSISGTILDSETQEAIPGVNVIVIGSNTGAASDFDGNFTLKTSAEFPFQLKLALLVLTLKLLR